MLSFVKHNKQKSQFLKTKKLYISTGIKWGNIKMSDFLNGFGYGLALSTGCGFGGFGYGFGFGPYDGVPSTNYLQTCYCDLEQPSGLNSVLDNGWGTNCIYRGGFNYSPFASCAGYGFGNYGFGLGGFGLGGFGFGGFGLYC